MESSVPPVELGMEVVSSDGVPLGPVRRIWYPDGRIVPPEIEQGLINTYSGERTAGTQTGFFEIDRKGAFDWFILFSQVARVDGNQVVLTLTMDELSRRPIQEKPPVP